MASQNGMLSSGRHEPAPTRQHRMLRAGLSLHFGNELACEASTGLALVEDHVRIVLVLEGTIDVSYGRSRVQLKASKPAAGGMNAAMVTMLEPEECRRVVHQGETSRRISIGLARAWLEASLYEGACAAATPTSRHLETRIWHASTRARMIAEQMLNPPSMPAHVTGMYLESRAIELVVEALSQAAPHTGRATDPGTLRPAAYQRMQELKAWLRDRASAPPCLEQIARHLNTTSTTLQRHFRRVHGITISDYLQQERLRQARQALEREGISVGEAAALAGYASQNSFATAFKRRFGVSPKQVRPRL